MKTLVLNVMVLLIAAGLLHSIAIGQPPPIPAQEQPEVLTRGPVHEAFSEPVILDVQTSLVAPNQPPVDIDEMPPAEMPQGDNIVWIPGYWSWDGDRNNYIWVSGCWRAAPPNMSWVPGYWSQESDGWEWIAGFWTSANIQDIEYLPEPPAYDNEQPSGRPPSPDDIWVPSCQYWHQDRYVDRPGYWLMANPDWVWTPSHYIRTPRGYIFCEGHWDYPLENRGVLFAPVYFSPYFYGRTGYIYSPNIVLDLGVLTVNMFTYPRYSHYYFGDYYDDSYLSMGIFPRYEVVQIHTWYDPTYVYDRWHHRNEPRWEDSRRQEYDRYRGNKDIRPPRTYKELEIRLANKPPLQQQNEIRIAQPLAVVAVSKASSLKFEHIDTNAQEKIATQATAAQTYKAERNRWESASPVQKTVEPPMGNKGPVTSPGHQKDRMTQPKETKTQPVTTPENNGRIKSPGRQKDQMTQPKEPKARPTMTPNNKGPVTSPAQPKEQITQPKTNPELVPPGKGRMTQPERVKVPPSPIVAKQSAAEKNPPPQPVNERKYKQQSNDTSKNTQGTDNPKDKVNPKDKGKAKGKSK
jgi:hypothetical protein